MYRCSGGGESEQVVGREAGRTWEESEGVVLDDRRLMIPPEIKHRRSREREVEVRHPFAHTSCHHKPRFRNMRRTRSAYPVANGGGLVTITAT